MVGEEGRCKCCARGRKEGSYSWSAVLFYSLLARCCYMLLCHRTSATSHYSPLASCARPIAAAERLRWLGFAASACRSGSHRCLRLNGARSACGDMGRFVFAAHQQVLFRASVMGGVFPRVLAAGSNVEFGFDERVCRSPAHTLRLQVVDTLCTMRSWRTRTMKWAKVQGPGSQVGHDVRER
ncbi:hypothetical protein L227DRAFT_227080 [Lentinus tigrinus ALCF2SS1-6]|uniref:Uncharacterized protein n=1 Tax=Lentinus tigrinus ALCF2SS1-6 TaxID=1328759 RepID=A0A5C2S3Z1_9APHY|nr:hypothetical protein L227DRAFT_227080 [Lentinus tigrinus ALCF2SS1-6]